MPEPNVNIQLLPVLSEEPRDWNSVGSWSCSQFQEESASERSELELDAQNELGECKPPRESAAERLEATIRMQH